MNDQTIIRRINALMIDILEVNEEDLIPRSNFYKIGRDSLDYVWLYVQVEKTFNFKITAEEIVKVKSLADFYSYVIRNSTL
jgi:acyl carrier protein